MKAFKYLMLALAVIIAALYVCSTKWSIIDNDKLNAYITLEQSKQEIKLDTIVKSDTLYVTDTVYLKTKTRIIKDTVIIADSTKLQELANLYMSTYNVVDTICESDTFELQLSDIISQNKILSRTYNLSLFKHDTVFIKDINHISTIERNKSLHNQIIVNWHLGSKYDFSMYNVTYLHSILPCTSKIQLHAGCGIGYATFTNANKFAVMNLAASISF